MAKAVNDRKKVVKRTAQGGSRPKTSAMNKVQKNSHKPYRGQGWAMEGKGSKQRPTDLKKYHEGWDRIFGKSKNGYQSTQTSLEEQFDRAIMKNEYYDLDDEKTVDKK